MRIACFFLGLGLLSMACGDSSSGGDLFAPSGAQGTGGASSTGSPSGTSSTADGAGGSDAAASSASVGTGGVGTGAGGDMAGAAGSAGAAGAATGGSAGTTGAGGDPAGTGGASGGAGTAGSAGSGVGGASGASGAAGSGGGNTVDAGAPHPIHCGTTTCAAGREFCCILDKQGATDARCVANGGACSDAADRVYCDDRTDCSGTGEVCCAADNLSGGSSTAACVAPAQCVNQQRKDQQLCDPQLPNQCIAIGMTNPCRLDNNATIPGYAYCH